MKKWFAYALALAMLLSPMQVSLAEAVAPEDPEEVVSAPVEEAAAAAEEIGVEGLTVGYLPPQEDEGIPEIADAEDAAPETGSLARYGILKAETEVSGEKSAADAMLVAPENGTVLILESGDGWTRIAFNSEYGTVTGYVPENAVAELDAEAVSAFLDAMAVSGGCAFYNGDPQTPLETLECGLPLPAPEADALDQAVEDVTNEGEAADGFDEPQTEMLAAAGFVLANQMDEVVVGGTCVISAMDASGKVISAGKLTYASSNEKVATVNSKGVVTAKGAGSASILVTYKGKTLADTIVVPKEPDSIHLNYSTGSLGVKEYFSDLAVIMEPAGRDASVTWKSSNTKYVKVDPQTGVLYGVKAGSATITATTRNGKKATCKVTVKKAPSKVTLSVSQNTLITGETVLTKAAVGSGTVCSSYTYETSNPKVATVDEYGVITGVGTGTATITAITYNGKKASVKVTVYGEPARVVFPSSEMTLGVKQTVTLAADVTDAQGIVLPGTVTYSLDSGEKVVTLNAQTGALLAVKAGTAVVRATASNGVSGTCQIKVVAAPVSITLNATEGSIGVKEIYEGLRATLIMSDGSKVTDGEVTWSSSSTKVLEVEKNTGALYGVKAGTATVTAKSYNGLKATCKVTVCKAPSKITLSPDEIELSAGATERLSLILPNKSACSTFYFHSSNPAVATVDGTGLVTGVGAGKATITCETYNGHSDTCVVTVYGGPTKVTLSNTSIAVGVGKTAVLSATATTASGSVADTELTYYIDASSPNPGCVRIDAATGVVTGVSAGTALVGVRTGNGITAQKLCTVTVQSAQSTPVALVLPATYSIGVGEMGNPIPAQIRYSNGDLQNATNLEWTSSKTKYLTVNKKTGAMEGLKKGTATVTAKTNGMTASCKVTVTAAPNKVTVAPTTLKLAAGGMKFTLQTSLPSGTSSEIYFRSSNSKVATVSEAGVITTVGQGTATIYATTYNNKSAACALTVTGLPAKASFAQTSVTLSPAQTVVPQVSVTDGSGSAAMADLTFRIVSGANYISLDSATGEITALRAGTSVVSVETHNGVVSRNNLTVVVKGAGSSQVEPPVVSGFAIANDSEPELGVGMTYEIETYGASGKVTWESSKKSVATVSSKGVVTAVAKGSAVITGTDGSGNTVTCNVTVKKAPTSVSISPSKGTLYVGATGTYEVTIPSGCVGTYTFNSSNTAVARVNDIGLVTAISAGTANITVTTYNGHSATAKLTVKDAGTPNVPSSLEKLGLASYTNYYSANLTNAQKIEHVIYLGQTQLGMQYIYGAGYKSENPKGFDCSGFVYWCYYWGTEKAIKLGSSAKKQGYDSDYLKITSINDLKRGDVVCFNTVDDDDLCDHTGIYLGKGYFMHASSAGGKVMISELSSGYYNRNFSWARRILE